MKIIYVNNESHKAVKIASVQYELSMQEVAEQFILHATEQIKKGNLKLEKGGE